MRIGELCCAHPPYNLLHAQESTILPRIETRETAMQEWAMNAKTMLSRRSILKGLAVAPTLSAPMAAAEAISHDEGLIALGQQLFSIRAALDHAGEHDEVMGLLERIDTVSDAIVAMPAKTVQGLYVKARATAWALLDDIDPMEESSINDRVAASIVRDLIRLYDPSLEQPDALKRLLAHE